MPTTSEHGLVQREDGSWLLAGYMPADEMADHSRHRPARKPRLRDASPAISCRTCTILPATGECVDAQGWRFEVVDLDGRRIDKVIASRLPGARREMRALISSALPSPLWEKSGERSEVG